MPAAVTGNKSKRTVYNATSVIIATLALPVHLSHWYNALGLLRIGLIRQRSVITFINQ